MDTRHFHKHLFDQARQLFGTERVIVVAVSGGSDSMALLHGLARVNELRNCNWQLHVAHLDHGVPSNSKAMCDFVRAHARDLGLPIHHDFIDVPALAAASAESIEEAGRKARYRFLESVCAAVGARRLVTAHHAEDQAETVLFRILRGTSLRGLCGMQPARSLWDGSNVLLVRPMLGLCRMDGVAYLDARGIGFMHDDTNDDPTAGTRNYLRQVLFPEIEARVNPQAVTALRRLADQQAGAWDYLQQQIEIAWQAVCCQHEVNRIVIDATQIQALHSWMIDAVMHRAVITCAAGQKKIDHSDVVRCRELFKDVRPRTIEFAGGLRAQRRGRFIEFTRDAQVDIAQPVPNMRDNAVAESER